jgi:hypothetical protein
VFREWEGEAMRKSDHGCARCAVIAGLMIVAGCGDDDEATTTTAAAPKPQPEGR